MQRLLRTRCFNPVCNVWAKNLCTTSKIPEERLVRCSVVDNRYVSPWAEKEASFWNLLTWQFNQLRKNEGKLRLRLPKFKNKKSKGKSESIKPVAPNMEMIRSVEFPHLTWIGHSSCLYQMDGLHILTDPVWSSRASPFQFIGPKRSTPPNVEVEDLPVDVVLLSHTHYDHFDINTAKRIGNRALWVVPLGVKQLLADIDIHNCVELNWWEKHTVVDKTGGSVDIVFTPAKHWTARSPFDKNTCLWGSFAVLGSKRMYFAGDTAYCPQLFKTIGDLYGPFDLSLLPIGAYRPRELMKACHVDPVEAVQIHHDIRSKQSVAIHWGTFLLADDEDVEAAFELGIARTKLGMKTAEFCTMAMGETLLLGGEPKNDMVELCPEAARAYISKLDTPAVSSTPSPSSSSSSSAKVSCDASVLRGKPAVC